MATLNLNCLWFRVAIMLNYENSWVAFIHSFRHTSTDLTKSGSQNIFFMCRRIHPSLDHCFRGSKAYSEVFSGHTVFVTSFVYPIPEVVTFGAQVGKITFGRHVIGLQ